VASRWRCSARRSGASERGVHESIIPAAVAAIVPAERRPSAYGIFTAAYGLFWCLGSALIGFLYDISIFAVVAFSIAAQLGAIPFFLKAATTLRPSPPSNGRQSQV